MDKELLRLNKLIGGAVADLGFLEQELLLSTDRENQQQTKALLSELPLNVFEDCQKPKSRDQEPRYLSEDYQALIDEPLNAPARISSTAQYAVKKGKSGQTSNGGRQYRRPRGFLLGEQRENHIKPEVQTVSRTPETDYAALAQPMKESNEYHLDPAKKEEEEEDAQCQSSGWWDDVEFADIGQIAEQADFETRRLSRRDRLREKGPGQMTQEEWKARKLFKWQRKKDKAKKREVCNTFNMKEIVDKLVSFAASSDEASIDLPSFSRIQKNQVKAVGAVLRLQPRNTGRCGTTFFRTSETGLPSSKQQLLLDKFCENVVTHGRPTGKLQTLMNEVRRPETMQNMQSNVIEEDNKGNQMLRKLGWQEGMGIGAQEQGALEPMLLINNKRKRGLGFETQ